MTPPHWHDRLRYAAVTYARGQSVVRFGPRTESASPHPWGASTEDHGRVNDMHVVTLRTRRSTIRHPDGRGSSSRTSVTTWPPISTAFITPTARPGGHVGDQAQPVRLRRLRRRRRAEEVGDPLVGDRGTGIAARGAGHPLERGVWSRVRCGVPGPVQVERDGAHRRHLRQAAGLRHRRGEPDDRAGEAPPSLGLLLGLELVQGVLQPGTALADGRAGATAAAVARSTVHPAGSPSSPRPVASALSSPASAVASTG